jgi:hypothetical protein
MLGQSVFEGLTLILDLNRERADTLLVVVAARSNCQVEDARRGFTYITFRDSASIIRNQWGDRMRNYKVLYLLRDC